MEELQDAIEDAQYVNAIATQEDGPRPVLAWDKPTDEELASWEASKKKATANKFFDVDMLLSNPIGLFLFSSYMKEKGDYLRINFCEEVVRFKRLQGRERLDKAAWIAETYLSKKEAEEPQKTEIEDFDFARLPPDIPKIGVEQMAAELQMNFDYPTCTESWVGLKGPVLKEVLKQIKEMSELLSSGVKKMDSMPALKTATMRSSSSQEMAKNSSPISEVDEGTTEEGPNTNTKEMEARHSGSNFTFDEHVVVDADVDSCDGNLTLEDEQQQPSGAASNGGSADGSKAEGGISTIRHASMGMVTAVRLRAIADRINADAGATLPDNVFDRVERIVMESLRKEYWESYLASPSHGIRMKHFLWYQDRKVVPDDFFIMRVLGRGGFGLVQACKKGTSGKLYAMKVMSKRRIKMKKSEQLTLNERRVLAAVESPFVVNLKYSFQSKDDVYLVLDLMTGGDLAYHLHQRGRFPKKEATYYAARIMLGLQALHERKYVYRDLKPENCLLAEDGRVKISDMGLATQVTKNLRGAAGTRGYWAPEMLRRDKKGKRMSYDHCVDWFSFGCCVAEFVSGTNPFRSSAALNFGLERGNQTKEKALDCAILEMDPELPAEKFESDAADIVRRLLDKNPKTRLGADGCDEIMSHPWFKGLKWDAVLSDRQRPPWAPPKDVNAASQSEIGNFTEDQQYLSTQLTDEDQSVYDSWNWTNPNAFASEVIEFLIYERETGEPLLPITNTPTCCCTLL